MLPRVLARTGRVEARRVDVSEGRMQSKRNKWCSPVALETDRRRLEVDRP